jgi:hypothetical protein
MGRMKGYKQSEETKAKLRAIATGRKHSPETIERMRRARLANLAAGKGGLTPEGRAALSAKQLGKEDSEETRRKKSESAKRRVERMGLTLKPDPTPKEPKARKDPRKPRVEEDPEQRRSRQAAYRKTYRDRLRAEREAERETERCEAELRKAHRKAMLIEVYRARKSSRAS